MIYQVAGKIHSILLKIRYSNRMPLRIEPMAYKEYLEKDPLRLARNPLDCVSVVLRFRSSGFDGLGYSRLIDRDVVLYVY